MAAMRALGFSGSTPDCLGDQPKRKRSSGVVEGPPLRSVLCSGGGDRRTVSLQRGESRGRRLGVEVKPLRTRRRRGDFSHSRSRQLGPADGVWIKCSKKRSSTGRHGEESRGEENQVRSVQLFVGERRRKRRKEGAKQEKETTKQKEGEGDGRSFNLELERREFGPTLQGSSGFAKKAEVFKLNRRHRRVRRGSAISGNPTGAEDSQILPGTAEQAGAEGCKELFGVWTGRDCAGAYSCSGDAEVLPSGTGGVKPDAVNAERVSDSVHRHRLSAGGASVARHGCAHATTQSHRSGLKRSIVGVGGESGGHKGESESFFEGRSQHCIGRIEARTSLDVGDAAADLDAGWSERKRRKKRDCERQPGEDRMERRKRKGEGRKGEGRSIADRSAATRVKKFRVMQTREFEGSLPDDLVAGLSDDIGQAATTIPHKCRKGTNDPFIGPIPPHSGSFYEEGLPDLQKQVAGRAGVNSRDRQIAIEALDFKCLPGQHRVQASGSEGEIHVLKLRATPHSPRRGINESFMDSSPSCSETLDQMSFEHSSPAVGVPRSFSPSKHKVPDELFKPPQVASRKRPCMLQVGCEVADHLLNTFESISGPAPSQKPSDTVGREDPIFPLPIPSGPMVLRGGAGSKQFCRFDGWLKAVILGLNCLYGARNPINEGPPTKAQQRVLSSICERLRHLKRWESFPLPAAGWASLLQGSSINSYGEEVCVAKRVQWENLVLSLPEKGGVVPLTAVCRLGMLHYVQNPQAFLKPPEERKHFPAPPVRVQDEHWEAVARGLIDRNICTTIPLEDVLHVEGRPVLSGLFGVTKQEWDGPFEVLRLIMDLRPVNSFCEAFAGDTATLPLVSQLTQLELIVTDDLVICSEDLKAMFYCFELDRSWYKLLGFNKIIPASLNPPGDCRPHVLCARVLPMGFINSVAIAQHLHRNIVHEAAERAEVSEANELRRNAPWPKAEPVFRVYLDNFDLLQRKNKDLAQTLEGSSPSFVEALRSVYDELGLPRNHKKTVESSRFAEVQGAEVDGVLGCATPKLTKLARYLAIALQFLQSETCTQKQAQICAGGLVYIAMYQRPMMSCLNRIWTFITNFSEGRSASLQIPKAVKREVSTFICLLPLARIGFRSEWSSLASASDASEQGGGITVSSSLTGLGVAASTKSVRGNRQTISELQGVLVVSLFDGIGSLRVALDVLGVNVCGYVSIEQDQSCRRVLDSFFPSALHLEKVENVSHREVREWATLFSRTSMVLVGGGPPCQGVSGLNASRRGAIEDSRSNLVSHFPRIVSLVREHFPWCNVYSLCESVFSMSEEDRAIYTKNLNVLPYVLDAGDVSLARRERLYWFDWEVHSSEGCKIWNPQSNSLTSYGRIHLESKIIPSDFLQPGWKLVSPDKLLPTFTTAQPSAQPREHPAGIDLCSESELHHWSMDQHKFPPFQYRWKNGLLSTSGEWRLPGIQEREAILGFPRNYTFQAWPKGKRKQDPQGFENCRLSLLGNSWSIPVITILLQSLFVKHELVPSRSVQQLVDLCSPGKFVAFAFKCAMRSLCQARCFCAS